MIKNGRYVVYAPRLLAAVVMLLLLLGGATGTRASDVMALVAPLLVARDRGEFGSIEGRVYAEGQRGGAEPTPYAEVSVLLVPRSPDFEAELDVIKARYRDSPDAVVKAEPRVSAARLGFERALIDTGGGQLILGESTDRAGVFKFPRVPEGQWTLLAWRETWQATRPIAPKRNETIFRTPQVFGYTTVVYWRMPLTVKAGEEVTVRLHDRNEWLTGIREDRRIPGPQPVPGPSGSPR